MKKVVLSSMVLALTLMSCDKDLVDPTNADITAEPIIALPLGQVNLTLEHLFAPDDSLIFEDNATYQVVVAQDSVFGISVSDLISIPAQSPSTSSISMGTISVSNVNVDQSITLGSVANNVGGTFQLAIESQQGNNAPFPSLNESNAGTYGGSGFGTFTSASFSAGSLTLSLDNSWPVEVSVGIDLVNSANNTTILSYNINNVTAGGTGNDTKSLVGITLPSSIAFKIASISSPGASSVLIDSTNALDLNISSANMEVYTAVTQISTQDISSDTQYVDLSTGGSEELRELYLNTASFDFTFNSSLAEDLELQLSFPGSDKNGNEVDTTITIAAGNQTTGSINLNQTLLDLTQDPNQSHSKLPIAVSATLVGSGTMVTVDSSDALDMTFAMNNLEFGYIKGYFGQQSISIDPGAVDLAIDFLDNFEGSISFADPKISLDITNSIGLPIQLDLDFSAYENGTAYGLNGPSYVLPYPTTIGAIESGTLSYDNTNSSIVDIFTLPKDSIVYGGAVNVNHDTTTYGTDNFVTNDGFITGDLLLDMPFYFTATGLSFGDTIAKDRSPSDVFNDSTYLDYAKLLFRSTTTLPLDVNVDINFYDTDWNLVLVKSLPLLESGTPDANGNITTANTVDSSLDLTIEELEIAVNAANVLVNASMETTNAGTDPVRLRTDATIGLALGLEFKLVVIQ